MNIEMTIPVQAVCDTIESGVQGGIQYWAKVTAGFDFSDADRVPPARFNRVVWKGLMGSKPYPGRVGRRLADND